MKKLDPSIADDDLYEKSAATELREFVERPIQLDRASMDLDEERRQVYAAAKDRGLTRRGIKAAYRARGKGDKDADLAAYAAAVGATVDTVDETLFDEIVRGSNLWPSEWLDIEMRKNWTNDFGDGL